MNAIALALKQAGFQTPEDRLTQLAVEAWAKYPGANAGSLRRSHVMNALSGEMTWALLSVWGEKSALGLAVGHMLNKLEPKKTSAGGGQSRIDTQCLRAPDTPSRDDAKPEAERRSEPARKAATPTNDQPAAPLPFGQLIDGTGQSQKRAEMLKSLADKQFARTTQTVKTAIRLSKLDTVMVGNKPIGDCTVFEVKRWAESRLADHRAAARDARFAMILVANLEGNKVIRDHWKDPNEVDAQYARAEAGYAA